MNQSSTKQLGFPAERLVAYQVAKEVVVQIGRLRWSGWAELGDQARRAAVSVMLNVAEGASQPKGSRAKRRHYDIALASCGEVAAALDAARALGLPVAAEREVARLGALVGGLVRATR